MNDIDFSFIQELEGNSFEGYVPDPENSDSGVTIAGGFDLGQRSLAQIDSLNLSRELTLKLRRYAGYKKDQAEAILKAFPLKITEQEAKDINNLVHKSSGRLLEASFLDHAGSPLGNLSKECQTVIASVAFQYGNLSSRCPNFWRQVTKGEWVEAYFNLLNFGDAYPTRRRREADLLKTWIDRTLRG